MKAKTTSSKLKRYLFHYFKLPPYLPYGALAMRLPTQWYRLLKK